MSHHKRVEVSIFAENLLFNCIFPFPYHFHVLGKFLCGSDSGERYLITETHSQVVKHPCFWLDVLYLMI